MGAGQLTSMDPDLRAAESGPAAARLRARKTMPVPRRGERRTGSVRVAVVLTLFVALVAAALFVGDAVIDPVRRSAAAVRDGKRVGEIVYSMPDGSFCRRLAFDNETATLTEGAVEPCPANLPKDRTRSDRNFAWGAR
jgi:hypothetical protein